MLNANIVFEFLDFCILVFSVAGKYMLVAGSYQQLHKTECCLQQRIFITLVKVNPEFATTAELGAVHGLAQMRMTWQ